VNVEQECARGVGNVRRVHAPAREAPQEKRIDGAERQLTALGACARPRHVIEHPGDLGAGEVRVEQQARLATNQGLGARGLERRARLRRAPVLPDDGAMDRLAGGALPDDRRLALIGDAERRDARYAATDAFDDLAHRRERVAPDVLRVVLDPSGGGVVLLELATRAGEGACRRVKYDGARRSGALVDGEDVSRCAHGVWGRSEMRFTPAFPLRASEHSPDASAQQRRYDHRRRCEKLEISGVSPASRSHQARGKRLRNARMTRLFKRDPGEWYRTLTGSRLGGRRAFEWGIHNQTLGGQRDEA